MVRRYPILVAVAAGLLGLGLGASAQAAARLGPALPRPGGVYPAAFRRLGCEQELARVSPRGAARLVIAGASITAGVGSGPGRSWGVLLARHLHWDTVIVAVPGAGYLRRGAGQQGPVAAEIARAGLRAVQPSLVIVQAGHDDIGVPPGLESTQVARAVAVIRAEAPRARIALLTVFPGRARPAAALRTDQAIVRAARAADPAVIIIDPLTGGWRYPHVRDGLHPTAAGSAWIASRVAAILSEHRVRPAPAAAGRGAIICGPAGPSPAPRL